MKNAIVSSLFTLYIKNNLKDFYININNDESYSYALTINVVRLTVDLLWACYLRPT